MQKIKSKNCPAHLYSTCFSSENYRKLQIKLSEKISIRVPAIWNNLVESNEKEIRSTFLFKTKKKKIT